MTEREKEFLLKEFETAWQHLRALDDRRYQIFQYFAAFLAATLAGFLALVFADGVDTQCKATGAIAVSALWILVAWVSRSILRSERRATERYRSKINIIRQMFIYETSDTDIKHYNDLAGEISVGFSLVKRKELKFSHLFSSGADGDMRCTALYIVSLLDTCIVLASILLIGGVYVLLRMWI